MITDDPKPISPPQRGRRWWRALGFAIGVVTLLVVALIAYSNTDSFHAWVHGKVVASLEDTTGGRVELGQVRWDLSQLNFVAHGLVIHGLEAPEQAPFIRADGITVDAKMLSWIGRQVGLRSVIIEHPVIHLIVYPDGHTNQPRPTQERSGGGTVQRLFDLKLDHAELRNGVLLVNDRAMPFDFNADELQAAMSYVAQAQRFDGSLNIGKLRMAYKNLKPFTASADTQFSLFPNQLQVKGLKIASQKSRVEASGQVIDFADPHADLSYTSVVDLTEAGEILLLPQLRRGTMTLNGTGQYTTKNYGTTGKLTVQKVEYRDPTLVVAEFDGGVGAGAVFGEV